HLVCALLADRPRGFECELAADPGVDDEGAIEQVAEGADHGIHVGVPEIQGDSFAVLGPHEAGQRQGQDEREQGQYQAAGKASRREAAESRGVMENDHAPILMIVRSPTRRPIMPRKASSRCLSDSSADASASKRTPARASQVPVPESLRGPCKVWMESAARPPSPVTATRSSPRGRTGARPDAM